MKSLEKFNKKIWPAYVNPEKNELFSSWLLRISKENLLKSHSFSRFYFNDFPIWNRDIDKLYPSIIVSKILENTMLSSDDIKELFLESYRDIIFTGREFTSYTPGILNIGINHRIRKLYGLLCCPSCLNNEVSYFKKEWRLFFSIACLKCNCLLIDRCQKCSKPISFHRLENGYKNEILKYPFYLCWNCLHDYRENIVPIPRNSNIEKYQNYIDYTIDTKSNDLTQYSFLFFKILCLLSSKILTTGKTTNRIKLTVEDFFNSSITTNNKINFSLEERKEALLISFSILENWPYQFQNIFKNSNVRRTDFTRDIKDTPYWFEKEILNLR